MNFKKSIFLILLVVVLALPLVAYGSSCGSSTTGTNLDVVMTNLKDAATAIGTAIIIIGFIVAGILWLTSAGSPEKMTTAKRALIAAVIGALIIALAQASNLMSGLFCALIQ